MFQKLTARSVGGGKIYFVMATESGQPIEGLSQQDLARLQQDCGLLFDAFVRSGRVEQVCGPIQNAVARIVATQASRHPMGASQHRGFCRLTSEVGFWWEGVSHAEIRDELQFLMQRLRIGKGKGNAYLC